MSTGYDAVTGYDTAIPYDGAPSLAAGIITGRGTVRAAAIFNVVASGKLTGRGKTTSLSVMGATAHGAETGGGRLRDACNRSGSLHGSVSGTGKLRAAIRDAAHYSQVRGSDRGKLQCTFLRPGVARGTITGRGYETSASIHGGTGSPLVSSVGNISAAMLYGIVCSTDILSTRGNIVAATNSRPPANPAITGRGYLRATITTDHKALAIGKGRGTTRSSVGYSRMAKARAAARGTLRATDIKGAISNNRGFGQSYDSAVGYDANIPYDLGTSNAGALRASTIAGRIGRGRASGRGSLKATEPVPAIIARGRLIGRGTSRAKIVFGPSCRARVSGKGFLRSSPRKGSAVNARVSGRGYVRANRVKGVSAVGGTSVTGFPRASMITHRDFIQCVVRLMELDVDAELFQEPMNVDVEAVEPTLEASPLI